MKAVTSELGRRAGGFSLVALAALAFVIIMGFSQAFAGQPSKDTYFVCPSVSTHNDNGMWVMGAHGIYYVLIPTKGGTNDGSKVYITVPDSVASQAQTTAGPALYGSEPTYPNFEGHVMLLAEGISTWLGSPSGWQEGDMASVSSGANGTYVVTNTRLNEQVELNSSIPMASAVIW